MARKVRYHPLFDCDVREAGQGFESGSGPMNDANREFFLGLYRAAVDYYKPKIEKRTGVLLGDIAVWDYPRLSQHVVDERWRRAMRPWPLGIIRAILFRRSFRRYCTTTAAAYAHHASKCGASYFNNAIYVSFDSGTAHEVALAEMAVHELSHALWERLAGISLHSMWMVRRPRAVNDWKKFQLLTEGYATYAARVWFLDFYPRSVQAELKRTRLVPNSIYVQGIHQIRKLVEQQGPQILLEIPKRWRNL